MLVQSRKRSFQWHLNFENRLANDAAVPLTLEASVFDPSRNRCVGKLRAGGVHPFPVQFTKAKHASLEQEKIFPMKSWFWKSIDKWLCSASDAAERYKSSINREIDASANSSKRCSAVSRSIHKSKTCTCSFRAGKDLSSDIFGLKVD